MKPMIRLVVLVLVVAASLTSLPSSAQTPIWPKTCPELCAIIFCAFPSTCGPFVDSTGTLRCGCHT